MAIELSALLPGNIYKDVMVPAAAALGALWIASWKFRSEQLWKERYLAYKDVLGQLEVMRIWGDENSASGHMLPTIGVAGLEEAFSVAQREISRNISVGSLLLSKEFVAGLENFFREYSRERFDAEEEGTFNEEGMEAQLYWARHAAQVRNIVDRHLPDLVRMASSHLNGRDPLAFIQRWWRKRFSKD